MLSVLRIVVALLYIEHGTQKLFGFPPPPQPMHIALASLMGVAGILETVGGIGLLLGLFTRPIAFLLAGEMAIAYFKVHFQRGLFPINNMGELAILYCFIYLYLMFAGAGPWSLDAAIASSRTAGGHAPESALRRQHRSAA